MLITYILGFLSGFAFASFFLGKELYRFYLKNKVQGKQIERLRRFKNKNKKTESQSGL